MKTRITPGVRRSVLKGIAAGAAIAGCPAIVRAADPMKIGFLGPVSGALAFVGQTNQNCLNLAVDEINAAGGILGQKVEVVAEDSQMSSKVTLEKARKLVSKDGVAAITGLVLPFEREAVLTVAAPQRKMLLYPNFDEGRCHPSLLVTGLATDQIVTPVMGWLAKNVGKSIYLLASDLGTNRQHLAPAIKKEVEKAGGKLIGVQYFPFGTRDYGPALQQVRAAGPDIVWHAIGDDPITFLKQYKSFDMKPQVVTPIMHESIAAALEGDGVGVMSVECYFMSMDHAANRKFVDAYTARYAGFTPRRVQGKVVVLPHGERTYVAAKLFAEAANLAGSTDADKLRAVFNKVEIAAPRGTVRLDATTGHVLSETMVGRVKADNSVEAVARLGVVRPSCIVS